MLHAKEALDRGIKPEQVIQGIHAARKLRALGGLVRAGRRLTGVRRLVVGELKPHDASIHGR